MYMYVCMCVYIYIYEIFPNISDDLNNLGRK